MDFHLIPLEERVVLDATALVVPLASDSSAPPPPDDGSSTPDSSSMSADTMSLSLSQVDAPPSASNDTSLISPNEKLTLNVLSNDTYSQDHLITVQIGTLPQHGTVVVNADNTVSYTRGSFSGPDSFTYTIFDQTSNLTSNAATISLIGSGSTTPPAPVANADSFVIVGTGSHILNVLANDTYSTVDILVVQIPSNQTLHGSISVNNNNTIDYAPAPNYLGPDSFTYKLFDKTTGVLSSSTTVTILQAIPVAVNDFKGYNANEATLVSVLANDTYIASHNIALQITTQPQNGMLVVNGDDTVTYTSNFNYWGSDSFSYKILDLTSGTSSGIATVSLLGNFFAAPAPATDFVTLDEGSSATIDVLANDTYNPSHTIQVQIYSQPLHGALLVNGNNTVTYTPAAGYSGGDSFSYTIFDQTTGLNSINTSPPAVVSLFINSVVVNAPEANGDMATVTENGTVTIDVLSNDYHDPNSLIILEIVTAPQHGTVTNLGNALSYTPNTGFFGSDTFTYRLRDATLGLLSDPALVQLTVTSPTPITVNDFAALDAGSTATINVLDNDTYNPLHTLLVQISSQPEHGTVIVNGDNTVTYTPAAGYSGPDGFTYIIFDQTTGIRSDQGGGSPASVSLFINSVVVNAPEANGDMANVAENGTVTIDVLANDYHDPNSLIIIEVVTAPQNGTVTNLGNALSYTPNTGFFGSDTFTYRLRDATLGLLSDPATVDLTVVSPAPVTANDFAALDAGSTATINVLDNDTYNPLHTLLVQISSQPEHGTVIVNGNNTVTYTPAAGYSGPDGFTYIIFDQTTGIRSDQGGGSPASVSLFINSVVVNAPEANGDMANVAENGTVTIDVLANDYHDPNSLIILEIVTAPQNGIVTNLGNALSYTPNTGFFGSDTFTYRLRDATLGLLSDPALVQLTVISPTPITVNDFAALDAGSTATINVLDNDTYNPLHTLLVQISSQPEHGTVIVNGNNTVTYTPAAGYSGPDGFTYIIFDQTTGIRSDQGGGSPASVSLFINSVVINAPEANGDMATVNENGTVTIDVLANDYHDPNSLIILEIVTAPQHGIVTNLGNAFSYTPNTGFFGSDAFTYRLRDATLGAVSDPATVDLTVVSPAPITANDFATLEAGSSITINVLANDTYNPFHALLVEISSQPHHGSAIVNADNTVTYTSALGYAGPDEFFYTILDQTTGLRSGGNPSSIALSITVDPPDANADSATLIENGSLTLNVLGNDSYEANHLISIEIVDQPLYGQALINANQTITYTPDSGFFGSDSFTYKILDQTNGFSSNLATVALMVRPIPPQGALDVAFVNEDYAMTIDPLANDTYNPDHAIRIALSSSPTSGSVAINGDNTITYTPNHDFFGQDAFTYQIIDESTGEFSAPINVFVTVIDAPEAVDDNFFMKENGTLAASILANDTYEAQDAIAVQIASQPQYGSVVINGNYTVSYTPAFGFFGTDTFTYQIYDQTLQTFSEIATVAVNVDPIQPVAASDSVSLNEDSSSTIDVLANDTYGPTHEIHLELSNQPNYGVAIINPDNTITYTPNPNFFGGDAFTYRIVDDSTGLVSNLVSVTLTVVAEPPEAINDTATLLEGTFKTIDILANDTYEQTHSIAILILERPQYGSLEVNPDHTVTYTPDPSFFGSDSFTYRVDDRTTGVSSDVALVELMVLPKPPIATDDSATLLENSSAIIDVLGNDGYGQNHMLQVQLFELPTYGVAIVNADNTITYTPNPDFSGDDHFSYKIFDQSANFLTAAADVQLTVFALPTATDDSATLFEDTFKVIDLLANDSYDANHLIAIQIVERPQYGSVEINPDHTVTYTPNNGFSGSDSFTYRIVDRTSNGTSDLATVELTVLASLVITADDSAVLLQDNFKVIDLLANDTYNPGHMIAIQIMERPQFGRVEFNPDDTVTYIPNHGFSGSDSFTYRIYDQTSNLYSDPATVSLTVIGAPVAVDDSASVDANLYTQIAVLDNDTYNANNNLILQIAGDPLHGTVSINDDHTFIYAPNLNFEGIDSFSYTIFDQTTGLSSNTANVSLVVNNTLLAQDDVISTSINLPVYIDVLSNDVNRNPGATLSVDPDSLSAPLHGTIVLNQMTNQIQYIPDSYFFGSDSFNYRIKDSHGLLSGYATVSIQVNALPPSGDSDFASLMQGDSVLIAVLANDSESNGLPLSIYSIEQPLHGSATIASSGQILYTPASGYYGADEFTYTVTDESGLISDSIHVSISVIPLSPVAQDDSATVTQNESTSIPVLANDYDPNGLSLIVSISSNAQHGTLNLDAAHPGQILYTPDPGYVGGDSFDYTITNSLGGIASAHVDIQVAQGVITANDDSASGLEDGIIIANVLANDQNVVSPSIIPQPVYITQGPSYGSIEVLSDGTIKYTPNGNFSGLDTIKYAVLDTNNTLSNEATLSIDVIGVADAPIIHLPSAMPSGGEGTPISLGLSVSLVDTDGSEVLGDVIIQGVPSFATLTHGYLDIVSGNWIVSVQDIESVAIIFNTGSLSTSSEDFILNVDASSVESANQDVAHAFASLTVHVTADVSTASYVEIFDHTRLFIEGHAPVLVAPYVRVVDPDTENFAGGYALFGYEGAYTADDQLSLKAEGSISLDGDAVYFDGQLVGHIDSVKNGTNGVELQINFDNLMANITQSSLQKIMRSLQYSNTSEDPGHIFREITYAVNDGENMSNSASNMIEIKPVNDGVDIGTDSSTEQFTQGTTGDVTGISLSDVDGDPNELYTLILSVNGGSLSFDASYLNGGDAATFLPLYSSGSLIRLIGTMDQLNQALDALNFTASKAGIYKLNITVMDSGDGWEGPTVVSSDSIKLKVI